MNGIAIALLTVVSDGMHPATAAGFGLRGYYV